MYFIPFFLLFISYLLVLLDIMNIIIIIFYTEREWEKKRGKNILLNWIRNIHINKKN